MIPYAAFPFLAKAAAGAGAAGGGFPWLPFLANAGSSFLGGMFGGGENELGEKMAKWTQDRREELLRRLRSNYFPIEDYMGGSGGWLMDQLKGPHGMTDNEMSKAMSRIGDMMRGIQKGAIQEGRRANAASGWDGSGAEGALQASTADTVLSQMAAMARDLGLENINLARQDEQQAASNIMNFLSQGQGWGNMMMQNQGAPQQQSQWGNAVGNTADSIGEFLGFWMGSQMDDSIGQGQSGSGDFFQKFLDALESMNQPNYPGAANNWMARYPSTNPYDQRYEDRYDQQLYDRVGAR